VKQSYLLSFRIKLRKTLPISELKSKSWDFFAKPKVPRFSLEKTALKRLFSHFSLKQQSPNFIEIQGLALFFLTLLILFGDPVGL
jgi:hypothetical protein